MSEIRVNTIVAAEGISAPTLPYGVQVPTGMGITGAGGVNISGVVTAANIDGTLIAGSALNSSGVSTVGRLELSKDANIGAAITVAGISKFTNTTDSTSSTTGGVIVTGGLGVAKNVYIGAGLSVAGTLTYQDVTEVDSVGLITAQSGVNISGGQLVVGAGFSVGAAGVGTFAGNLVVNGDIDLAGSIDVDGTCEADAYTVAGTALDTHIAGVTVTNSTNSAHVYVTDNESTNENNLITFVENAESSTGNHGLEMDGDLTYTPALGRLTATQLAGTLQTAAQTNITSLGDLTGLECTGDVLWDNGTNADKDVFWDASANSMLFYDAVYAKFGTGSDAHIVHDGSHFTIKNGTGDTYIQTDNNFKVEAADGGNDIIHGVATGTCEIHYNGSVKLHTTNDGAVTTGIHTCTTGLDTVGMLRESFNTTAGKMSDNTNIDLDQGMIHYFTTQESTTCTPNIRYNSSKSLNNMMNTGDVVSVTVITTAAAGGYSANWTVDGNAITEQWNGGSAPSEGGSDGYDVYTITLLKTAANTYTAFANVANFT